MKTIYILEDITDLAKAFQQHSSPENKIPYIGNTAYLVFPAGVTGFTLDCPLELKGTDVCEMRFTLTLGMLLTHFSEIPVKYGT